MTGLRLLDEDAIRRAPLNPHPYPHAVLPRTFRSREVAAALAWSFPTAGYARYVRETGSKRHALSGRHLVRPGQPGLLAPESLSPLWVALGQEIRSDAYREALGATARTSLEGLEIEATLWRQTAGGFIDPHPDNPGKVLAHLIYLSDEAWRPEWGGCLRILRSRDLEDVACEVLPRVDTSVFFVRSERSWHGYKPIQGAGHVRLAVQVVFCRPDMRYSGEDPAPNRARP